MTSPLDKEVTAVSCDTMNKIKVGTLAVSRYHQIRKIFLQSDQPNYPDHDFSLHYKLIPDGILKLQNKEDPVKHLSVITENDSTQARNDLILAKHLNKVQSLERSKAIADHQEKLDNNLLRSDLEIKKTCADGNYLFESIAAELSKSDQAIIEKFSSLGVRKSACDFLVENINQLADLVLDAVSSLYNRTIILYTSLDAMPLLIFKSDNPNGPSNEQADVISTAYNACAGHEHYSSVQKLSNIEDEITVGEYEAKISVIKVVDESFELTIC